MLLGDGHTVPTGPVLASHKQSWWCLSLRWTLLCPKRMQSKACTWSFRKRCAPHMTPHSASPGKGEAASLQIDLKGALYNAVLAPSACTLAVVNLGPSEARVEMLASQFLQLERVHGLGDGEEGQQHLWDDQDQEQVCDFTRRSGSRVGSVAVLAHLLQLEHVQGLGDGG